MNIEIKIETEIKIQMRIEIEMRIEKGISLSLTSQTWKHKTEIRIPTNSQFLERNSKKSRTDQRN